LRSPFFPLGQDISINSRLIIRPAIASGAVVALKFNAVVIHRNNLVFAGAVFIRICVSFLMISRIPDSVDQAQEKIREHVEAIEKGEKITTPVQVGQILARAEDGKEGHGMLKMIAALYRGVANLQQETRETRLIVQELAGTQARSFLGSFTPRNAALVNALGAERGKLSLSDRMTLKDLMTLEQGRAKSHSEPETPPEDPLTEKEA